MIPMLWLGVSLLVHARIRRVRGSMRAQAPAPRNLAGGPGTGAR